MKNDFLDDIPDIWPVGTKRHRRKAAAIPLPDPDDECQPPVIYHVLRCPKCSSEKVTVHTTRRPIRYHTCADCGHNFKSVEYSSN